MCEKINWEYDHKPFKEKNWIEFTKKINVEFPMIHKGCNGIKYRTSH